jgi:hypothetical protein
MRENTHERSWLHAWLSEAAGPLLNDPGQDMISYPGTYLGTPGSSAYLEVLIRPPGVGMGVGSEPLKKMVVYSTTAVSLE